jgi:RNA polymerase sigma-70 factor (ECF subfamily)
MEQPSEKKPASGPDPPSYKMSQQPPDDELIRSAADGHYEAFEKLVGRYHHRIYRLAMAMTQSSLDSEEVVQETFLSVFRHLKDFRYRSAVSTWIWRIATNAALMRLRSGRRKPQVSLEGRGQSSSLLMSDAGRFAEVNLAGLAQGSQKSWAKAGDEHMLTQELRQHLTAAIADLPEKHQMILLLRDVEGYSNDDVAEALGLTVATVKARLHRARLFVRQRLAVYFNGAKVE